MVILKEILANKWFFTFLVGYAVFIFTVEWKKLYINVWGGILSCLIQLLHDKELSDLNLYQVHNAGIWILNQSAFFTFGIVFTMGVIFLQYLPRNVILQLIHVIFFSLGLLLFEYITVKNGLLKHIRWNYWGSMADNVIVISSLAWFRSFLETKIFKVEGSL